MSERALAVARLAAHEDRQYRASPLRGVSDRWRRPTAAAVAAAGGGEERRVLVKQSFACEDALDRGRALVCVERTGGIRREAVEGDDARGANEPFVLRSARVVRRVEVLPAHSGLKVLPGAKLDRDDDAVVLLRRGLDLPKRTVRRLGLLTVVLRAQRDQDDHVLEAVRRLQPEVVARLRVDKERVDTLSFHRAPEIRHERNHRRLCEAS